MAKLNKTILGLVLIAALLMAAVDCRGGRGGSRGGYRRSGGSRSGGGSSSSGNSLTGSRGFSVLHVLAVFTFVGTVVLFKQC